MLLWKAAEQNRHLSSVITFCVIACNPHGRKKKKALISLPAKILNLKSQITLNPVLFFYLPCEWAVKANVDLCHLMLLSLPYTDPVDKYVSSWWCFY